MKRQLETAQDRLEELERLLKVNQREISHKIESYMHTSAAHKIYMELPLAILFFQLLMNEVTL